MHTIRKADIRGTNPGRLLTQAFECSAPRDVTDRPIFSAGPGEDGTLSFGGFTSPVPTPSRGFDSTASLFPHLCDS